MRLRYNIHKMYFGRNEHRTHRKDVLNHMRGKNKYYADSEEAMARAARAAYMRKWRAANKDKVKRINQNYWARKAAQMTAEQ